MRAYVLIAGAIGVLACASPGSDGASEVRAIIEAHNADIERWYASGDVDSLVSVFAEDAWQMPPHQPPLTGREALRAFWSQAFTWGRWRFDLDVEDVVASGRIAVERGRYQVGFSAGPAAPAGMGSFEDRGNYVVLWRKEADDRWRAVWDAPVSALPLRATTVRDGPAADGPGNRLTRPDPRSY